MLIDGRYLSTSHGTGIATYARNINRLVKSFGHQVDVLCDMPVTRRTPPALGEVFLYDPYWRRSPGLIRYAFDFAATIPSLLGHRVRAHEIQRRGFVVDTGLASQLPAHDRLLSVPSVFSRAAIHFEITGRFLQVGVPGHIDIAHWTLPLPIAARGARNIYTIHDIIPLKLPYTTRENRNTYYKVVKRVVETADHLVVVSETTSKDVADLFPAATGKMTNTYQAVALPPALLDAPTSEVSAQIKRQFGLDAGRYFLFYAAIEPKKNLARLIKAYLSAQTRYPLIIVGRKAWLFDDELLPLQIVHAREALGGGAGVNKVVHLDYLPFPELVSLIRGARAVLFPSIYEGFGLPILEAMTCGTPVMTSDLGAMREVATPESAVLVDPYDVGDISRGIERLSGDDDLLARLSTAGRARAEAFSWARYAERLAEVYGRMA